MARGVKRDAQGGSLCLRGKSSLGGEKQGMQRMDAQHAVQSAGFSTPRVTVAAGCKHQGRFKG